MRAMLGQSLYLQWKTMRWPLVPFVLAAFGVPLLALRQAHAAAVVAPFSAAENVLYALQYWTLLFPLTAALLGITFGLSAWSWDHRTHHVYALSLPLARWEYALLKFAAGVAFVLIPVVALLAGTLLGLAGLDVPDGLHAYPFAFAFRFLLAVLIAYAVGFAAASSTVRTAIWILSAYLAFLILGSLAVGFAREALGMTDLLTPLDIMGRMLARWPGPFHVFGGNWMPIDV